MAPVKPVRPRSQPYARQPAAGPPEVVEPGWILKALGAVILVGFACAYLTLCIFFYKGQWQFVLHPSRVVAQTPAAQHVAFEAVRFADDRSGQPQLTGWWIPSESPADPTVLVLHGETGSMSDALPFARALHDARLNVFLFDYRGYGDSLGRHPTETQMRDDAASARQYLVAARHVSPSTLLIAGLRLGASLAVHLCAEHPETPGLLLLDADGDTVSRVEADQRSRILPVGLLFHERFSLADPLHRLRTPKLLVSFTRGEAPEINQRAADPKLLAELAPGTGASDLVPVIRRFLGLYVSRPVPTLQPSPRP